MRREGREEKEELRSIFQEHDVRLREKGEVYSKEKGKKKYAERSRGRHRGGRKESWEGGEAISLSA